MRRSGNPNGAQGQGKRKVSEGLILARTLISNYRRWCKFVAARDEHGARCSPNAATACRWCAYGALERVGCAPAYEYLHEAARKMGYTSPLAVNDNTDHEKVMQMFTGAILQAVLDEKGFDYAA